MTSPLSRRGSAIRATATEACIVERLAEPDRRPDPDQLALEMAL